MNHLFESFSFLNRDSDARELERYSLRAIFAVLLPGLFLSGMVAFMMLYDIFRLHRFSWTLAVILVCLSLPTFRSARLIYRSLPH
jgi:hypothetical protein